MSDQLKLIFVHVPKTGGTAVCEAIAEYFPAGSVLDDRGDQPNNPASPMNLDPQGFLEISTR